MRCKIIGLTILSAFLIFFQEIVTRMMAVEIIKNFGISFSSLLPTGVIYGGVLLFLIIILRLAKSQNSWGLIMVVAGGISNTVDRLRFGYVRDYWQISQGGIYNNINDCIIMFGILIFIIELAWKEKSK